MKRMYATTEHAEQLIAPSKTTNCGCGQTYALIIEEEQVELVVCDACRKDAPYNEQW
jgi:hypothetical protein